MYTSQPTLPNLFSQLGLPSDDKSIEHFISHHFPLEESTELTQASFWNEAQREFLQEAIRSDSDWAIVVDELNTMLRDD